MAVPAFVGAGTGVAATTGTLSLSKTTCTAGNLLIAHVVVRGTSQDWSAWSSESNISSLAGAATTFEVIIENALGNPFSSSHFVSIGRVTANGTCSADAAVGASGEDLFGRMYEFSGASTGTTMASVIENDTNTTGSLAGTGTQVDDEILITNGADRLGCAFVGLASNQTIGDFTGESGGDWVEAVAEYSSATGATATLQLQTASLPSAGTIDGGSVTVTSVAWGVTTLAIIPTASADPGDDPPFGFSGRGAGW